MQQFQVVYRKREISCFIFIFTGRNEGCEGYVFTGVCLSTGRRRRAWLLGACMVAGGVCAVAGGHVWLLGGVWLPGGMRGKGGHAWQRGVRSEGGMRGEGGHVWDTTRYGDTINERVVRILLECILVNVKVLNILARPEPGISSHVLWFVRT